MPLDPRSRERLEALGRTLPQTLPAPEPVRPGRSEAPRHAVETEENPEQLFRELMAASADGSVPPHLLDRLRQLEKERQRTRPGVAAAAAGVAPPAGAAQPGAAMPSGKSAGRPQAPRQGRGRGGRRAAPGSDEAELYTAFAQLLLEDEELD